MSKEDSLCFLCGSSTTSKINNTTNKPDSTSFLSNNLDIFFLLRNLLQVPPTQLENRLKECGSSPENWLSLCDKCTKLTSNARKLHHDIRKIKRQLGSIQCQVLEKIRQSNLSADNQDIDTDNCKGKAYPQNQLATFSTKIKRYVKSRKFLTI